MESQPQNPEFRNKPENFHPWICCIIIAMTEWTPTGCHFKSSFCFTYLRDRMIVDSKSYLPNQILLLRLCLSHLDSRYFSSMQEFFRFPYMG